MDRKWMAEVWIEKAKDAFEKGDLVSAEIKLMMSNHLSPSADANNYLELVTSKRLNQTPSIDFSQYRTRKFYSKECIFIAKLAIEKGDFELAKKFLSLADEKYQGYVLIDQKVKRNIAEKLIDEAKVHFKIGNFGKAEQLLIKSQNIFSSSQAQTFLKQVQDAVERERINTEKKLLNSQKIGFNLLNILTCTCYKSCGSVRLDDDLPMRNEGRNASSSSRYFYRAEDLLNSSEAFGYARDSSTVHLSPSCSTSNRANSTQYNFSENISENYTNSNADCSRNYNNDSNNNRNSIPNSFRTDALRSDTNNNNDTPGYSYRSAQNTDNESRASKNRSDSERPRNAAECSTRRNNTATFRNDCEGRYSRNSNATYNSRPRSRQQLRSRFFRKEKEYTDEQLREVNRVLASKDDYVKLGLSKGSKKEDISAAFRRLALVLHPDKNKAPRACEAFIAINDAKYRLIKHQERPGPGAYKLPTTVGFGGHDPSRFRNPMFSFGTTGTGKLKTLGPGPAYRIQGVTRDGVTSAPAWSFGSRIAAKIATKTPGPGAHAPERCPPMKDPRAPQYSMGARLQRDLLRKGPAPNAYALRLGIGTPAWTMGARLGLSGKARSPGPAVYFQKDQNIYKNKCPIYSLGARLEGPGKPVKTPGPAAYPPNLYNTKNRSYQYSFGTRHGDYAPPMIIPEDTMDCL